MTDKENSSDSQPADLDQIPEEAPRWETTQKAGVIPDDSDKKIE